MDSFHTLLPFLYPKRCDSEAYITDKVDMTDALAYLSKKNLENPENKTTMFALIVTAMVKTVCLRPKLNRYIMGKRYYQRYKIPVGFIAKREFADSGEEALVQVVFDENDNLDSVMSALNSKIKKARSGNEEDTTTNAMNFVTKFPRFLLSFLMWIFRTMEYYNIFPKSLVAGDPNYSAVFIANLGSIKCDATYHHLNEWGTSSIFLSIGILKKERVASQEDDSYEIRDIIDFAVTLDERIADGYYYAKSIKLLKYLLNNPELLEKNSKEDIEYVY